MRPSHLEDLGLIAFMTTFENAARQVLRSPPLASVPLLCMYGSYNVDGCQPNWEVDIERVRGKQGRARREYERAHERF